MTSGPVFRLLVSSTLSDFLAEREALQKRVFLEKQAFCQERGAGFVAVDLNWGNTEESQRGHDTMRICIEEVRGCLQVSYWQALGTTPDGSSEVATNDGRVVTPGRQRSRQEPAALRKLPGIGIQPVVWSLACS